MAIVALDENLVSLWLLLGCSQSVQFGEIEQSVFIDSSAHAASNLLPKELCVLRWTEVVDSCKHKAIVEVLGALLADYIILVSRSDACD